MTPLYYAISGVLVVWHDLLSTFMDLDGPGAADPAVRQADQLESQHAADPAEGQGAAEEVRPRPGASRPGDDEALQGQRHQPVRLVPADPDPDADLPGAVPAARQARGQGRQHRVPECRGREELRRRQAV